MATKKKAKKAALAEGVESIPAGVGDPFTYIESGTLVEVCGVDEEAGTVDVQEPEGAKRYWGGVPSNSEWLGPAPAEE